MLRSVLIIGVLIVVPSIASAQQPCTTDARQVVNEIYRHMLERAADPASSGWVDSLAKGTTVREVVGAIAKSAEHLQRFGSDARAVDTLYRHILGRQPDAAGQRTYAGIAASRGLGAVVDQIISSPEYQQSFGDWGVPGSGGVTYCAKGAASARDRAQPNSTQPDRSQADRGRPDQGQAHRSPADRNQPDRDAGDRNQWDRNSVDRNQPDRSPGDRNQSDWSQADGDPSDRYRSDRGQGDRGQWDRHSADRNQPDRFEILDRNGDRLIGRNEWDGGRDVFGRLDTNRDGRLARNEFNAGYSTGASSFNSLDVNHDRRITLNEWPWSRRSFDAEDLSHDGAITRGEFRGDPAVPVGRRF